MERALHGFLPKGSGRIAHIFGVYGFHGAVQDPKKLALTELLFQAVLCEARALGNGQPIVITGGFNVQPVKTLSCYVHGTRRVGGS